jgi:hypothetical protein
MKWNGPPRPKKKAGVTTSVRLDIDIYIAAQRRNLNVSEFLNKALRQYLKLEDENPTEEQLRLLLAERHSRIENVVEAETKLQGATYADAINELQLRWNVYRAAAPDADRNSRLMWVTGHRERNPSLQGQDPEVILADLGG